MTLPVQVVRLDPDLPLPAYAHPGDAGADHQGVEGVSVHTGSIGPAPRARKRETGTAARDAVAFDPKVHGIPSTKGAL